MINNRQNGRRRGRGGTQVRGPNNGPDRGNRIDNRARGNAAQLHEKYKNLARDAQTQGDRVMTEYYLQFADHYFRVLNESRARFEEQGQHQQQRRARFEGEDFDDSGYEPDASEEGGEAEMREPREVAVREQPREAREGRRERRPVREPRERTEVAAEAPVEAPAEPVAAAEQPEAPAEEAPRRRRGRPRRVDVEAAEEGQARLEIDRLPPAVSTAPAADSEAPAEPSEEAPPRRRRTRRVAASEDHVAA